MCLTGKNVLGSRIQDLKASIFTRPNTRDIVFSVIVFLMYAVIALPVGFMTGFLDVGVLQTETWILILLPVSLFFMPALFEEIFFRVLMLPHKSRRYSAGKQVFFSLISVTAFVIWHPVNAATINRAAYPMFTDPVFLSIAALMATACTVTYLRTGSLWVPVVIHWITAIVWVFFLGGRNVVLD